MDKKIVFFETEDWERGIIDGSFNQAELVREKLTLENVEKYKEAEIVSCFIYSSLNQEVLAKFTNLKCVATRSTGFDHIDLEYCKAHNII
ncbi:hydroxyacid dehydrogenase, partial [Candidatus Woesebacteria bacterium]|nr:hydroxyacid dehydrogenase [Candidatus Woesebacteria bacterium]